MRLFNLFSKTKGNLGFLSTYNIEDVYYFIGEKEINNRIKELENKATMGFRLEHVVEGINKTGPDTMGAISCLSLFINWFPDSTILDFLYNKLDSFNESNYMKNSFWAKNRTEKLNETISHFKNKPERKDTLNQFIKVLNSNYYYSDYHFFLINLYRKLLISKDETFKIKIYADTLVKYPTKIAKIKECLIDIENWVPQGLGNSILQTLEKYCEQTNQTEKYESFFIEARNDGWRF